MSKSEDNTNELESYGVWVKNTSSNDNSTEEKKENLDTEQDDMSLDLPDFDDTEFSDMFKDEAQFSTDENIDDFGSDSDTTLSTDELANITDLGDVAIENDDVEPISMEENELSEPIFDTEKIESSTEDEDIEDSIEIEDISNINDNSEQSVEEEISLDDFMDDGFSDESITSGNNGYEPGAEKTENESTEEISLDDFLDESSLEDFSNDESKDQEEDDEPLNMDISFDDSVDSVETEENLSLDNDFVEEMDDSGLSDSDDEEVSFDDFNNIDNIENETTVDETTNNNIEDFSTEEVDLSDFGIDADAEETPIVQDVEEEKNKEKTVDYDLFIESENTSSAPLVNELKESELADNVIKDENESTSVDNSLLQQIVSDLSSLREEINNLKTNIEEIKANEAVKLASNNSLNNYSNVSVLEDDSELNGDTSIEIPEEDNGGFFNSDDTDETIALSGDELSNIMNNADFGDTQDLNTSLEDNAQDNAIEDSVLDEEPSVISETVFDNSESETSISEPLEELDIPDEQITKDDELKFDYENEKLEEPDIDEITIDESEEELPSEISIPKDDDIFVESNATDFMDSVKDTTENEITEPDDNTNLEPIEELNESEVTELSEEIEDITELDDLESEDNIEKIEEIDSTENLTDDSEVNDETDKINNDDDLPTIDSLLNNSPEEEMEIDEVPTVEKVIENNVDDSDITFDDVDFLNNDELNEVSDSDFTTPLEENELKVSNNVEEQDIIEDIAEDSTNFDEIDNLNNELSSSNIEYLTTKDDDKTDEPSVDGDLKQEIKSVLLYMDQLLENLPEEKIYEFAKSDEFATYKKLFKDLGLS